MDPAAAGALVLAGVALTGAALGRVRGGRGPEPFRHESTCRGDGGDCGCLGAP